MPQWVEARHQAADLYRALYQEAQVQPAEAQVQALPLHEAQPTATIEVQATTVAAAITEAHREVVTIAAAEARRAAAIAVVDIVEEAAAHREAVDKQHTN